MIIRKFKQYFLDYCEVKHLPLINVYNLVIKIYRGNLIHSSHHRCYHRFDTHANKSINITTYQRGNIVVSALKCEYGLYFQQYFQQCW